MYTELPKFNFRYCVYNFINISTHETDILGQEADAVGAYRVRVPRLQIQVSRSRVVFVSSTLLTLGICTQCLP